MNFKDNESSTKLRGGYYTPADISDYLTRWVMQGETTSVLEPSCGDGSFLRAFANAEHPMLQRITAIELDADEAALAALETIEGTDTHVINTDFLSWAIDALEREVEFDAVVGNPPFIRYQYLEDEMQELAHQIFNRFGLRFTKHTNAWVPFIIASVALLRPGGRIAMVIPSEILHVLHAQSLRSFLGHECSKIVLVDPEELLFDGALQGAVLLLATKAVNEEEHRHGVCISTETAREFLQNEPESYFENGTFANGETVVGKWMLALLTVPERELLLNIGNRDRIFKFNDIAKVDVGIVTGANKFFLVDNITIERFGLHQWAHPMFGRSNHVNGVIYNEANHQSNQDKGLPTNFLWFDNIEFDTLPELVQEYIKSGEAESLHTRYKCRIRKPWFKVPSVYGTPVGMLKRCHRFPRLIYNEIGAFTTDTAYRITPLEGIESQQLVYSFVNSLTSLSAELEGRHYGGGVLELVPSEIEKLLVPLPDVPLGLEGLNESVANGMALEDIFDTQDQNILGGSGLSPQEIQVLRNAAARLRGRRLREH